MEPDQPVRADLRNGERFAGSTHAYFDTRTDRFDLRINGRQTAYEGRMGDIPALNVTIGEDGLLTVVHQTRPSLLRYTSWEKFAAFAEHKDFPEIEARHRARGLPMAQFTESYTRHVKALIAIGSGAGQDSASGMETEFVALANPYTDDPGGGIPVRLLYGGAPRPDAQVEIFERAPDGTVTIARTRTDARGEAVIAVRAGHRYLLDAVVLRPAPPGGDAVWESLWAALTFAVP